jgi:hypothetical protein
MFGVPGYVPAIASTATAPKKFAAQVGRMMNYFVFS